MDSIITESPKNLCTILAIATVSLIIIASYSWIIDHPFGTSWDEAHYFNRIIEDHGHFKKEGLEGLVKTWLRDEGIRPPAYRVLAFPITCLFGFSPIGVRLTSILFLVISIVLIYLAASKIAGPTAGALAAMFVCLIPGVIIVSTCFATIL